MRLQRPLVVTFEMLVSMQGVTMATVDRKTRSGDRESGCVEKPPWMRVKPDLREILLDAVPSEILEACVEFPSALRARKG